MNKEQIERIEHLRKLPHAKQPFKVGNGDSVTLDLNVDVYDAENVYFTTRIRSVTLHFVGDTVVPVIPPAHNRIDPQKVGRTRTEIEGGNDA